MALFLDQIGLLLQPLALSIVLVFLYGRIAHLMNNHRLLPVVLGLIFGIGAVLSMSNPIVLAEGFITDLRFLYVGIAAGFFGFVPGALAAAIAIGWRLYLGGGGAFVGSLAVFLSFAGALAWHRFVMRGQVPTYPQLILLGLLIGIHLGAVFLLPQPIQNTFWQEFALGILGFDIVGALLVGSLLKHEAANLRRVLRWQEQATTDPLTGLLNRRGLEEAYDTLTRSRRTSAGWALMVFDIDRFKAINDAQGHAVGDKVLTELSARISGVLGPGDVFARSGGDEFVIVLPNVDAAQGAAVAERCRAIIEGRYFSGSTGVMEVTISAGLSWQDHPINLSSHIKAADRALYKAKEQGRNRVVLDRTADDPPDDHVATSEAIA